jgi:HEAT repeat protein
MRSVAALIESALTGVEDDEAAWAAIRALQHLGDASVFEAASALARSTSEKERGRGVDILGQLGSPRPSTELRTSCATVVLAVLATEKSTAVLHSIGVALGHLRDARAIDALLPLKAHHDSTVRHGVVLGLSRHEEPRAIAALIELSRDEANEVRNWATFGLAQLEVDTEPVREALLIRLGDLEPEIRGEALVGLAERKDARVLAALRAELQTRPVSLLAIEAAECLGDSALLPLLLALRTPGIDLSVSSALAQAIASLERKARRP